MFVTNFLFVTDPSKTFFMIADSFKFWENSDHIMNEFSDVFLTYENTTVQTSGYRFFNLITLILSYFAQLFDHNNILVQKIFNVFLGAFSIPYIYMILRKFFDKKKSFHYSLIYSLLSYTAIYSVVLFRDCHVNLLFIIGSYLLVYHDKEKKVFLKLSIILILLLGFRLEFALFFSVYLIAYQYLRSKTNKSVLIVMFFVFPVILVFVSPIIVQSYEINTGTYTHQMLQEKSNDNSTGAKLSSLPPGIKNVLMAVNSQIAPAIPFWRGWAKSKNSTHKYNDIEGYHTPWRFMESVGAIFSLIVWFIIFYCWRLKLFYDIPIELKILFLIGVLLLFVGTTVVNPRRVYCIYSSVFVFAMYGYNRLSYQKRNVFLKKVLLGLTVIYACLYLFNY